MSQNGMLRYWKVKPSPIQNLHVEEAQKQAETDIEQDVDLNTEPEPGDDLDEGELAKMEGED